MTDATQPNNYDQGEEFIANNQVPKGFGNEYSTTQFPRIIGFKDFQFLNPVRYKYALNSTPKLHLYPPRDLNPQSFEEGDLN